MCSKLEQKMRLTTIFKGYPLVTPLRQREVNILWVKSFIMIKFYQIIKEQRETDEEISLFWFSLKF